MKEGVAFSAFDLFNIVHIKTLLKVKSYSALSIMSFQPVASIVRPNINSNCDSLLYSVEWMWFCIGGCLLKFQDI